MMTQEICQDDQPRRQAIREHGQTEGEAKPEFNGLDYLEVSADQRVLTVFFLNRTPDKVEIANVKISGGRRIKNIRVKRVWFCCEDDESDLDDCMKIEVDRPGDFATYTLCLIEKYKAKDENGHEQVLERSLAGIDPRFSCLDFSFKVDCPNDLDCATPPSCPPETLIQSEISYLAKDYASFRQLILDRLALLLPDWQERHAADLNIALVEILAYVGDYLSYYQDAVATEAYLETARQRISVRRHTRLVDYILHEGCNARAWVFVETGSTRPYEEVDPQDFFFITGRKLDLPQFNRMAMTTTLDRLYQQGAAYEVFEPMATSPIRFYPSQNEIDFYSWGEVDCCLPKGTTQATLTGRLATTSDADLPSLAAPDKPPKEARDKKAAREAKEDYEESDETASRPEKLLYLKPGDFLLFEEVLGPKTGQAADADPNRRHVVLLTKVTGSVDELYDQPVVEIEWADEDALPFALCLSAIAPESEPPCQPYENISVARGNLLLVDHGRRIDFDPLGTVPALPAPAVCDECAGGVEDRPQLAGRVEFKLEKGPLTFSQPLPVGVPAAGLLKQEPRRALPRLQIVETGGQLAGQTLLALPSGASSGQDQEEAASPASPEAHSGQIVQLSKTRIALDTGPEVILIGPDTRVVADGISFPLSALVIGQQVVVKTHQTGHGAIQAELITIVSKWTVQPDLLASGPDDYHFVVEMDNSGLAHLRFGDDLLGRSASAGATFTATYRIGNGRAGNVGAEAISHIIFRKTLLSGITLAPRNPLAAEGGIEPEPLAEAKLFAPRAFRSELQRAITTDDYARLAERNSKVQRAAAIMRWNGSWYEVQVAIDPLGTDEAVAALLAQIRRELEPFRRIGHDLGVKQAEYVPLDLRLEVCVQPHYLRAHLKAALVAAFSNRTLPDGSKGFFHPDNLSFGDGIYVSALVAKAQSIPGVESARVTRLRRFETGAASEVTDPDKDPDEILLKGVLPLSPLEVARLDNDPSFPENGKLTLEMRGGR